MADFPFHVAGGYLPAARPGSAARAPASPPAEEFGAPAAEIRQAGSRRRKLWELPHKFHCPMIGVCFACADLRSLMNKVMRFPGDTSDFVLHTTAVGNCEERTPLAELLHKTLEKRYRLAVCQFALHKTDAQLRRAWHAACQEASRIPAALWAVWTHPACDAKLEQDVYGDIHMIQHQVGAGARADVTQLRTMAADKARLQSELLELRGELETLRRERTDGAQASRQQLLELRAELAAKEAWGQGLHNELLALRSALPDLAARQELLRQRDELWRQHTRQRAELAERDRELARLRAFARHAEETFAALAGEDEAAPALPPADLAGKCVLCVGGRAGAIHSYREAVEQSGGRFLHHDGGLEESFHRIDGALAAADIVICQAGCISHNAYWRVKDLCKRTGKPCMFVRASGATSFLRTVEAVKRRGAGERA